MARPGPKGAPDELKAVAIAAATLEGNQRRICRELGIPKQTMSRWMNGTNVDDNVLEILPDAKEAYIRVLEGLSWKCAGALAHRLEGLLADQEKLDKVNPRDLAVSLGVIDDKLTRARGEATTIIGNTVTAKESVIKKVGQLGVNLQFKAELPAPKEGGDGSEGS